MEIELNASSQENERLFADFLSKQATTDPKSLIFNLNHYRQQHPEAAKDVIHNPAKYYKLVFAYLEKTNFGEESSRKKFDSKTQHYNISFEGNLGQNFVSPRGLGSRMANQLVGIQGIITKTEIVRYQLEKSVHYCDKTKSYDVKEYPDAFNPEKEFEAGKTRFIKTHDDNNNPLEFQYGKSSFRDVQKVVIQELPEMAPPGLLPQSVEVVLQGTLVNSVKPGDRVEMTGIFKLIPGSLSKEKGIFKPFFLCLSVKPFHRNILSSKLSPKIPCHEDEIFSLFSRSIAPSIFGHEQVKKAVLLMILGGCEKVLDNGTHLRGDINILMLGDPGTAKSQILRWVLSTVDLAIGTTGSGASGVGLTAAVVSDKDTGEKSLEAGAMVLADRGVVCIDQFDKMNENDRVAVHEVMEQQTVTIAKAGIHCSLNARCAVIAACNPIYGEYQRNLPPTKNIGMPDSLLSRFDLVFVILDEKNAQMDKRVSERVIRNHRLAPHVNEAYNRFNQDDDFIITPLESRTQETIYEKSNVYKSDSRTEILTQSFLKRYVNYCKENVRPVLTDDSVNLLSEMWSLIREKDFNQRESTHPKVLPVTIRSHETLIRLSSAHAKLRQSADIEVKDCLEAFKLMSYCLEGDEHALDAELTDILKSLNLDSRLSSKVEVEKKPKKPHSKKDSRRREDETIVEGISKIEIGKEGKEAQKAIKEATKGKVIVNKEKETLVYKNLAEIKSKKRGSGGCITIKELLKAIGTKLTEEEVIATLEHLTTTSKIHFDEKKDKIYL